MFRSISGVQNLKLFGREGKKNVQASWLYSLFLLILYESYILKIKIKKAQYAPPEN